jgi:hypothetical protein
MLNSEEFKIGDQTYVLDPDNLKFTDATLNQFFEKISGITDYIGAAHARAMRNHTLLEHAYKQKYIEKYKELKEQGKSDKTAELFSEGDIEVSVLKERVINAKYVKDRIYAHLGALNSARDDAHNRGHMLRKEMDKLNMDVLSSGV